MPTANPEPQAKAAPRHRSRNNTRTASRPALESEAKRINTASPKTNPAQAKGMSVGWRKARRKSHNANMSSVSAGLSESRLLPVSSLTKPGEKTPTKYGENASNREARTAAARPAIMRPLKYRKTGPSAFSSAVAIEAAYT